MKNLFFSLLICNAILAASLCLLGVTLVTFPVHPDFYEPVMDLIDEMPWLVPVSGILFTLIGFFILIGALKAFKSGRFEVITGKARVWVKEGLIEKQLDLFWKKKFPEQELASSVFVRKNRLHIIAKVEMKPLQENEKEAFLQSIREELKNDLHTSIGYVDDFSLSLGIVKK